MTLEEAIREIEWIKEKGFVADKNIIGTERIIEACEMAIESIEKQIPYKVDTKTFYSGTLCPSCKELFEKHMDNWKSPYCQYCGVKLDWGE